MWWSRGIGGRSALDYLIKVRDYTFMEAVQSIAEQAAIRPPVSVPAEKTKVVWYTCLNQLLTYSLIEEMELMADEYLRAA